MWFIVSYFTISSRLLCTQYLIYIPNSFIAWYSTRFPRSFALLLRAYCQYQYNYALISYIAHCRRIFHHRFHRGAAAPETMYPWQHQQCLQHSRCHAENPLRRKPCLNSNKMRSDKSIPSTRMGYFEIEIRPNVVNVPANLNRFIPYNIPIDGYESDSSESDGTMDEHTFESSTNESRVLRKKPKKKRRAFISKKSDPDFNPNFPYRQQALNTPIYNSTTSINFNNTTFSKDSAVGFTNQYPGYNKRN